MKRPAFSLSAAGCVALLLTAVAPLHAGTTYTRVDEPRSGSWSDPTFWMPSTGAPLVNGDVADFTLPGITSGTVNPRTVIMDSDPTLLGIDFRHTWTLTPGDETPTPRTITLQADPGAPGSVPYLDIATSKDGGTWTSNVTLDQGITVSLIGGRFRVGAAEASTNYRSSNGRLTIKDGATLNIGTAGQRSEWRMAQHYRNATNTAALTSWVMAETGATVSAWLTQLHVGGNHSTADQTNKINGSVDLSAATVTAFDVSGDVVIGRGARHRIGSYGEVLLPKVNGAIGGELMVGDSVAESSGKLILNGTHLDVEGNVTIDLTGRVRVAVGEEAAGLRLSESSTLTINAFGDGAGDEDAGYFIDFTNMSLSGGGLLYGLAWEGDQQSLLTSLINSHAITWTEGPDGLTAGLFYDAGADLTYIGIAPIPEPGTVSLLVGGAVLLGWLGRRRSR